MKSTLLLVVWVATSSLATHLALGNEGTASHDILFMDDVSTNVGHDDTTNHLVPKQLRPASLELHPPSSPDVGEAGETWSQDASLEESDRLSIRRVPVAQGTSTATDERSDSEESAEDMADRENNNGSHRPDESDDEANVLDKAAETLSDIAFDKVFLDLDLLKKRRQQTDIDHCVPTFRDPYLGPERMVEFNWAASNLAHRTLYFDDDPLERYGYSCFPLLQPAISAGEFAKDLIAAPIRGIFDGPCKCHFVAGRQRVGSCACRVKERLIPR